MMPPVWPVYNADGSYNYQGNGYWRIGNDYQHNAVLNPVAMANLQSDVVDRMAIVGKVFAELELYKGCLLYTSFLSVADLAYGWRLLDRETFLALWIVIFALLGFYLLGKIKRCV